MVLSDAGPTPRIAFLLLAHEHPSLCARLAARLLEDGDAVFLHLDAKSDDGFRAAFEERLGDRSTQVRWVQRVSVAWGDWSMIEATLSGLRAIGQARETERIDYVYLLSGADYPTRSLSALRAYLQRNPDRDFIEHKPADTTDWVAGGFQRERYQYRHWWSWREHPRLFSLNAELQKRLGLKRRFPEGLTPHMGSQWWVLRWSSCERVLETLERDGSLARFFRTTVVPDELFFQSLVASWFPGDAVEDRHLTLYEFTEEGVPVVYYDGHEDFLAQQPFFFARKLSPRASRLRDALDQSTRRKDERPIDDAGVGRPTDDYRQFVRKHRTGLWGQRCWGRPGLSPLGEMERLKAPYFVLLAHGPGRLHYARQAVPKSRDWICHGALFDPERPIELTARIAAATGYGAEDKALRDQDRPAFLAEVLRSSTERAPCVGFMVTAPRRDTAQVDPVPDRLLCLLAADPNCHFVHVAAPGEHRDLRQALQGSCQKTLGLQPRAQWVRVHPRPEHPSGAEWPEVLRSALDARRSACERRHRAQEDGQAKPRLTLHIGIHRTGTTALQRALNAARPALAEQDVHYAYDTVNHNSLAEGLQRSEVHARRVVAQLIEEGLDSGKGHVVVSAENFASLRDPGPLWDLQRYFDVQVLAYLRRQDRWLESWYNQAIRWPWNRDIARLNPNAFYRRVSRFHWLDYRALHQRWSKVFGAEHVHFRRFESARADLLEDFSDAVGIPRGVLGAPPPGINASGSPRMTEALRHLDLMDRTEGERGRLVAAVRDAFATANWTGPAHAFSEAQRRRILHRHRRSNDWVAQSVLHEEPPLFEGAWPGRDRALPDLSLPEPDDLLTGLGAVFLRPWLAALPQKRVLMTLPETQRGRLVRLLQRQLGHQPERAGEAPGSLPDPDRDQRLGRLQSALGVGRLPEDLRTFAEATLAAWALRSDVPQALPTRSDALLETWFGALAEECERMLTIEHEARHWNRGNLEQRLDDLERSLR